MKANDQNNLDFNAASVERDKGIQLAVEHADHNIYKWSDRALEFLKDYLKKNKEFMVEQVREASLGSIPEPPSNRAWGAIVLRARKMGLIKRKGYKKTSNRKSHCTPATLWEAVC